MCLSPPRWVYVHTEKTNKYLFVTCFMFFHDIVPKSRLTNNVRIPKVNVHPKGRSTLRNFGIFQDLLFSHWWQGPRTNQVRQGLFDHMYSLRLAYFSQNIDTTMSALFDLGLCCPLSSSRTRNMHSFLVSLGRVSHEEFCFPRPNFCWFFSNKQKKNLFGEKEIDSFGLNKELVFADCQYFSDFRLWNSYIEILFLWDKSLH